MADRLTLKEETRMRHAYGLARSEIERVFAELDAERAARRDAESMLAVLVDTIRPTEREQSAHPQFEALLNVRDRLMTALRAVPRGLEYLKALQARRTR